MLLAVEPVLGLDLRLERLGELVLARPEDRDLRPVLDPAEAWQVGRRGRCPSGPDRRRRRRG